jgi:hypothetical protein
MPFTPNAASLLAQARPTAPSTPAEGDSRRAQAGKGDAARGADLYLERKKTQVAHDFALLMHPGGGRAASYQNFFQRLRNHAGRRQTTTSGGGATDLQEEGREETAAETQSRTADDGSVDADLDGSAGKEEEKARLAEQETNLSEFSPKLRWILEEVTGESKSAAEQYNFLNCAREMAKMEAEAYASQEAEAQRQLQNVREQLKSATDDGKNWLSDRCKWMEGLHVAIQADRQKAQKLFEQLDAIVTTFEARHRNRIRDGYNLIPKARFVVANAGLEGRLSSADLASNYRDQVLCMVNPSQFFENFMVRHSALGFRTYFELILQLLGDDIKSANPSRGIGQLQAIRDSLFFAEISHQIYLLVGAASQKLQRIRIFTQKEKGVYVPALIAINFQKDHLEVAVARGKGQPCFVKDIPCGANADHFAELTEVINRFYPDAVALLNFEGNDGRSFRFAVQRRYGLPMSRKQFPWESIRRDKPPEELFPDVFENKPLGDERKRADVPQKTEPAHVYGVEEVAKTLQKSMAKGRSQGTSASSFS